MVGVVAFPSRGSAESGFVVRGGRRWWIVAFRAAFMPIGFEVGVLRVVGMVGRERHGSKSRKLVVNRARSWTRLRPAYLLARERADL